ITVLLNRGSGAFAAPAGQQEIDRSVWSLLPFDFDGDGDLDLALGSYQRPGGKISLFESDGRGRLSAAVEVRLTSGADSLAAGDLDGDGDQDLAAGMIREKDCVPFFGCASESQ